MLAAVEDATLRVFNRIITSLFSSRLINEMNKKKRFFALHGNCALKVHWKRIGLSSIRSPEDLETKLFKIPTFIIKYVIIIIIVMYALKVAPPVRV